MADLFKAVEVVNKMMALRDDVRRIHGAGYDARVKEYMGVVKTIPEDERLSRLLLMSRQLTKEGNDTTAQLLVCAYIELVEQKKTPEAAHGR